VVRLSKPAVASLVVAGLVLGASLAVVAADAFQDRHMAMEAVGDAMKPLGAMAKKAAPFDAAVVKASATTIADKASALSCEALLDVVSKASWMRRRWPTKESASLGRRSSSWRAAITRSR